MYRSSLFVRLAVFVSASLVGVAGLGVSLAPPAAAATLNPVNVGLRAGATRIPFDISDEFSATVDVGSGNLMLSTADRSILGLGNNVMSVGLTYNSLALATGSAAPTAMGGRGFSMPFGPDTRVIANTDGSVLFMGLDSEQALFKPRVGGGFIMPNNVNKTLTKNTDGTWTVFDNPTRVTLKFTSGGRLNSLTDSNGNVTGFSGSLQAGTSIGGIYPPKVGSEYLSLTYTSGKLTMAVRYLGGAFRDWVEYLYDASGRLITVREGAGGAVRGSFSWSSGGDLASVTDGAGRVTALTYDSSHRVTTVTQGSGSAETAVTRFAYVSATQTAVALPNAVQSLPVLSTDHTTYTLDSNLRVTKAVDALGHSQSKSYTAFGNVATATNATGGVTSNTYGANGARSLTKSASPGGAASSATFGSGASAYRMVTGQDMQGNASTLTYDVAGNPSSAQSGATGPKASVTYYSGGVVKTSTDPAGAVTNYTENTTYGFASKMTPPAGSVLGAITASSRSELTNGAGQSTSVRRDNTYGYRTTSVSNSDVNVSYGYDGSGNLTSRTDLVQKATYTYDSRNNLTAIDTIPVAAGAPPAAHVGYSYDKSGNMKSRTVGGILTTYEYDAANRLTAMTTSGRTTRFGYNSDDRRTDTWWSTNSNNTVFAAHTHNDFDTSGRITRAWTSTNSTDGTRLLDTTYSYSKGGTDTGLIQTMTNNLLSTNNITTMSYDGQNRLTKAANWGGKTYEYAYDTRGNRTKTTVNGAVSQTRSFGVDNQITTTGYSYDKAGRRTQDPVGGSLTWNAAGQMTSQSNGNGTAKFLYAGPGQEELVQQSAGTTLRNYTYGRSDKVKLPTLEQYSSGSTVTTLQNDAYGMPIASRTGLNDVFYAYDGLGRQLAAIGTNGAVQAGIATMDPYGFVVSAPTSSTGSAAARTGSAPGPWATQGISSLVVTNGNWIKRGARWNDTGTGTWTSMDPVTRYNNPTRANAYIYVSNNPLNKTDPDGRDDWASGLAEAAGLVIECFTVGAAGAGVGAGYGFFLGPGGSMGGAAIGALYGCGAGILAGSAGYGLVPG